jgi:hypothetical protein
MGHHEIDDDVQEFLDRIEELREDGRYEWADDTLTGIYDTVYAQNRVTDGQRRAIDNIENAVGRDDD